jgi:hypothetical protein
MKDNVTAAPSTVRRSGAGGRTQPGGAAFRLPDTNSPTYAARCLKAGLEGLAPADAKIDGTIGRVLLEAHLANRARRWALDLRDEFTDLVRDNHPVPLEGPLVQLEDALHEIEYDLRDEWTWPSDVEDHAGPENSPTVIHNGRKDEDLVWSDTSSEHPDARVRYRTRLYFSILSLNSMGLGLFVMRSEWSRDLSGAAGYMARAHAFRCQLETRTEADRLNALELDLLERLMTRSAR